MNWDNYFISISEAISKNSKCLSKQLGCIIVRDRQILSTGYNGPPSGYPHCESRKEVGYDYEKKIFICPRISRGHKSAEGLEFCPSAHAEQDAILQAARNGVKVNGSIMYCSFKGVPCRECAKAIVNSGIIKIVLNGKTEERTVYDKCGITGLDILSSCGVKIANLE